MQRLRRVSQLGLVALVYPGANHSRFEHSLGVYRLACQVLRHLMEVDEGFSAALSEKQAKLFLIAALTHDIGHWPYCHPIEDMRLSWVPSHESLAREHLNAPELAHAIHSMWQIEPDEVADFLIHPQKSGIAQVLQSALSGPVDIDKMDYLQRDSLHAGVPYGRNFDLGRLVASLCVNDEKHKLAITGKGKTATEMMVFARYVMFSEVYWHHAVRSATAMLQRLVYSSHPTAELSKRWLYQSDMEFANDLVAAAQDSPVLKKLAGGLFGPRRVLFKRIAQFSFHENAALHSALARRPFDQLASCAEQLADKLSRGLARPLLSTDILIDAPPLKLEVQFALDVQSMQQAADSTNRFRPLAELSPVVHSLATAQFDNFVKQVRVFAAPDRVAELNVDTALISEQLLDIASRF
ncbi:MAG: HD domain-containing protein [Planctomycetales bacterium]|nr:HD domain-containing protein [Planctomycetales bacterium]